MSDNTPIREYNSNGKLIHSKRSDGYEYWYEYDANNNLIHYKNSDGYEKWYDSKGNVIDRSRSTEVQ
jgi:YD repeat-containing protein